MMLGLEQYLPYPSHHFGSHEKYEDPDSAFDDSMISSETLSEDITDIDEKREPERYEHHERATPTGSFDLLKLLSGKQVTKKKNKAKSEEELLQGTPKADITDVEIDTPTEVIEALSKALKLETLEELEAKMYSSKKSLPISEFLKQKRPEVPTKKDQPTEDFVEILSDDEDEQETDSKSVNPSQIGGVSVRDIFSNFAPKPTKHQGKWRYMVKLRISPAKLAELKKYDDPLKTRGNTGQGKSMLNMLMKKKPSRLVTLRLPSDFLLSVQKSFNPLYTKSSGLKNGKSASSVFAQMMQTANNAAYPKLTPLQKAKELMPPPIEKGQMHVHDDEIKNEPHTRLWHLQARKKPLLSRFEEEDFFSSYTIEASSHDDRVVSNITTLNDLDEYVASKAPLAFEEAPHMRIYRDFIQNQLIEGDQVWTEKFAPKRVQDLLLDHQTRHSLGRWIENAFAILKTQSTKTPRNVKIRQQQNRQRQKNTMLDFIVDDFEEEDDETEEDVFVPVLIIQGLHGLGKSASVYAAMNELDGYVYEVNSGQNRSRRELYGPLKEFCTTNIISKNEEKSFQKGLVLFEDCDVLFEQDKTFWTAVQDVINFSKRPIIISVQDITVVPKSIWEQAEEQSLILYFQNQDLQAFQQYLWLCCLSQGFDLTERLLDWVAKKCKLHSFDMRKALMLCQWLCATDAELSSDEVVSLDYTVKARDSNEDHADLSSWAQKYDLVSTSDVIDNSMRSMRCQHHNPNELLDVYVVDDGEKLNPSPEPDEINIGQEISDDLNMGEKAPVESVPFNQIRTAVLIFISSRTKKLPKILQDFQGFRTSTRSRLTNSDFDSSFELPQLDTQGLLDTSICYSMTKTPFILELTAFSRNWARFQIALSNIERERRQQGAETNIRQSLGWRQFQEGAQQIILLFPNVQELIKSIWS